MSLYLLHIEGNAETIYIMDEEELEDRGIDPNNAVPEDFKAYCGQDDKVVGFMSIDTDAVFGDADVLPTNRPLVVEY